MNKRGGWAIGLLASGLLVTSAAPAPARDSAVVNRPRPTSVRAISNEAMASAVEPGALDQDNVGLRGTPAPTPSGAAARWYEAGVDAGVTYNCSVLGSPYYEPLGRSWVGWHGDLDSSPSSPSVNQVYYVKVGWGVSGFPCGNGGAYVHNEIGLPAATQLAITNANKVRCFYQSPRQSSPSEFAGGCPQQAGPGMQGGLSFDPTDRSGGWPTATGSLYEIWIPVKTTQPLSGIQYDYPTACPSCLIAGVWMIDGGQSPWSFPRTGVRVSGAPSPAPYIGYPSPSSVNMTYNSPNCSGAPSGYTSYVDTVGYLYNGSAGTIRFQAGTTKSYGANTDYPVPSTGDYSASTGWCFIPGSTIHWRMCFIANGGSQICGVDQSFESEGPPDNTDPNTSFKSGPSGPTKSRTATFVLDSNELDVSYECKLDAATDFTPCTDSSPTYTGLSQGSHTLAVRAKDAAGNRDETPATRTWMVDTVAPQTSITSHPPSRTSSRKAVFKFASSEAGSRFLCSLDGSSFRSCSSGKTYTGLTARKHTFKVKAKDAAGNIDGSPAAWTWTIR